MKLEGKKWENYSTPSIDGHKDNERWKTYYPESLELKTMSVQELYDAVLQMKNNCELNHKDISEVPVFIQFDYKRYIFDGYSIGHGGLGTMCELITDKSNELVYTAPDSKPEEGEYWASRGATDLDCSGYVVSKKAGERIRRMVRYVLDKDETKSWLDFREHEPYWIQYKFSASEFDVNKLDQMSNDNNGVITERILRECVING